VYKKLKIFLKKKLVSYKYIISEFFWKIRLSAIIFLLGKKSKIGKVLTGIKTKGYYVIENYFSDEEVNSIKKICFDKLNSIPEGYFFNRKDNEYIENLEIPEKKIAVERMSGSIKLKRLQNTSIYLDRVSKNFFLLFLAFVQLFEFRKKALLIFSWSHDGTVENLKVPGSACDKQNIAGELHYDTYYHSLKAFTPLEDVTLENGPFAYLEGSANDKSLFDNYINSFNAKYNLSCNNEKSHLVSRDFIKNNNYENKIFYGTQKKGDLVIMDTKGVHCATNLKKGQRQLFWFYY
jgi:hypothetical protein